MILTPIIPAKIKINLGFMIFLRIINSGRESPVTAIIKARLVPTATPFSVSTPTNGMTLAALE